jgi:hypothetical protein
MVTPKFESKMIRRLISPLIWTQEATFDVPGTAEEGLRLLSDAVHSPYAFSFVQSLVGSVGDTQVTVWRYRPFVRNSFFPVFYGRFVERTGGATLAGRFAMHRVTKIFMSIWLTAVFCFAVMAILGMLTAAETSNSEPLLLFVPVTMLVLGLVLVHTGSWFARGDIAYITREIRKALQH